MKFKAAKILFLSLPLVLSFAMGCSKGIVSAGSDETPQPGGGGGGATDPVMGASIEGQFVDAPVAGLGYLVTSGSAETTSTGKFTCVLGEMVTFKVGNMVVGQAPCALVVFPMQLTGETTASNNGGAVALGVLFKSVNSNAAPGIYTIPTSVRNLSIAGTLNFANFNSSTDLISFKSMLDEISSGASLSLDTTAIYNDYESVHAPASAAELEANQVNPAYVSVPTNIGSFAGNYYLATAIRASGGNAACVTSGTVNFGFGINLAGTVGASTGTMATLYKVTVFRADSGNLIEPKLGEAVVTNSNLMVNVPDSFLRDQTGTKNTNILLSLGTTGSLNGSLRVTGSDLGSDACVYNFTTQKNVAPVASGNALLTISGPPLHQFGTVNSTSTVDQSFTVTNQGNILATSVFGSGLGGAYSFKGGTYPGTGGDCAGTLGIAASCLVVVTFAPNSNGLQSSSLFMNYNNGDLTHNSVRIEKMLRGTGRVVSANAVLDLAGTTAFNFGGVAVNQSLTTLIRLSNTGGTTATSIGPGATSLSAPFSYAGTGTLASYPGQGGTCGSILNPGSSCLIGVKFAPTSAMASGGTLEVSYNNGAGSQTVTRGLAGTGVMAGSANLSITPSGTFSYGSIAVGAISDRMFSVVNFGNATAGSVGGALMTAPFSFKGGNFPGIGGNCASAIAPAGSCSVVVSFAPTSEATSVGTLGVKYLNGSLATSNVSLRGSGYNPPSLQLSDAPSYQFGSLAVGATKDHIFTLSNNGSGAASGITGLALSAPFAYAGGSFPGTGGDCPSTLAGNSSCTIVTRFSPGTTGVFPNNLTVRYVSGGTFTISRAIYGTGTVAGGGGGGTTGAAVLNISDGAVYSFGSVLVGSNADKTFTVTNTGSLGASAMSGSGLLDPYTFKGGSYPGTMGTCGTILAASASCTMVVNFAPTIAGSANDTIDLSYNNGFGMQVAQRTLTGAGTVAGGGTMGLAVLAFAGGPSHNFGTIATSGSMDVSILVSNSGGTTATSMTGLNPAGQFSFKGGSYPGNGGTCGSTLLSSGSCNVVVTYTAGSVGTSATGSAGISYNNGSTGVSIFKSLFGATN